MVGPFVANEKGSAPCLSHKVRGGGGGGGGGGEGKRRPAVLAKGCDKHFSRDSGIGSGGSWVRLFYKRGEEGGSIGTAPEVDYRGRHSVFDCK